MLIIIYILSIVILYLYVFKFIFYSFFLKNCIILQNNNELRGGGGLITQTIDVYTFLGIPYRYKKHTFSELNKYSENFLPNNFDKITKKLIFRDVNFSINQEDNYNYFCRFYKKNFKSDIPNNFIIINFSLVESLFLFFPSVKINGFKINKDTLFRNLSHLTTDNPIGQDKRKFIIFKIIPKILFFIIFIPFLIHIILIRIKLEQFNKNFIVLNKSYKEKIFETFLGIEENNLLGRKDNRFIQNFNEYNFFILEKKSGYIEGEGKIKIHKTLFADDNFPISGIYRASIKIHSSDNIKILGNKYKYIEMLNLDSCNIEFNFKFRLKYKGDILIKKQAGIQNVIDSINIQTKSFKYLPKTNLINKKEHWNNQIFINKLNDINIKYNIENDLSNLKLQSRYIYKPGLIQLNFQKEIFNVNINKSFIIYKGEKIPILKLEHALGNKTCLLIKYNEKLINKYIFNKFNSAKILLFDIEDSSGIIHYKNGREITLPWKNI